MSTLVFRATTVAIVLCGCALDRAPIFNQTHPELAGKVGDRGGDAGGMDEPDAEVPVDVGAPLEEDPVEDESQAGAGSKPPRIDAAVPQQDASVPADASSSDAGITPPQLADAATVDSGAVGPSAVEPGAVFSTCRWSTDCDFGLICTTTQTSNADRVAVAVGSTGYCTTLCTFRGAVASECQQPSSGSVQASCQIATARCELESCDGLECPSGMQCVETLTLVRRIPFRTYECQP